VTVAGDQTSGTNTIAYWGTGTSSGSSVQQHDAELYLSGNSGISVGFGNVAVGSTGTYPGSLGLTNTGDAPLVWTDIVTGSSAVTATPSSGTLAAGGYVDLTLTFSPTATSAYNGVITVLGNQSAGTNTIAWSGTGTTAAGGSEVTRILYLSGNSGVNVAFGSVTVDSAGSYPNSLGITNNGNSSFTWTGIDTGSSTVSVSPSTGTVAAGGSVALSLTFTPTAATSYSGTITVQGNHTGGSNTIAWTGSGTNPTTSTGDANDTRIIALSGSLGFGNVDTGSTTTAALTITNNGNTTLTWTGLSTGGSVVSGSASSGTVPAGGSAAVTLTFTPAAATAYNGTITVTGNQTSGTNTIAWTGTGTTPAPTATRVISLSGNLQFGNVNTGASTTATLTIANSGNATLTWSGLGTGAGVVTASASNGTIAAGGSTTVTLTFSPSAVTAYSGTITVTGNQTSGTNTIAWTGTGTTPPPAETRIIALSGNMDFGAVPVGPGWGNTGAVTLTITNNGNATLTLTGLSTSYYPNVECGNLVTTSLAPGQSSTENCYFHPAEAPHSNEVGTFTGTFTVSGNQTSGTNTIGWTATTVDQNSIAVLYLSGNSQPGKIAFGNVAVGTSNVFSGVLGVANNGGVDYIWTAINTGSSTVTVDQPSGTLAPINTGPGSGYVELQLTFTPTAVGAISGTLTIIGNESGYSSGNNTMTWTGYAY
jgi:hypothetical protein